MCNTRSNVFLQSMKNNTLSVKKLTKNLLLKALRQLYAVSEIIILIRWVTPPPKVEDLQFEFLQFLQISISSVFLSLFFIAIYIWVFHVLYNIQLWLILQVAFHLSECDRTRSPYMIYSTQSVHKFFMCIPFETFSKFHYVLVSWRFCERNLKIF